MFSHSNILTLLTKIQLSSICKASTQDGETEAVKITPSQVTVVKVRNLAEMN